MAFNVGTFKTRTLTAAVFAIVMLLGLLINHWTFFILFSVIHFGCWMEYQKLVCLIDEDYKSSHIFYTYGIILFGWGFMLWMTNTAFTIGGIALYEMGWWLMLILVIALPVIEIVLSKQPHLKNVGYSLFGLLYISLSWGLMINIRGHWTDFQRDLLFFKFDFGLVLPLVLIASIWINDTMAYIIGSVIGKTPLSSISPKKTWEGTLGGAILAVVTVTMVGYFVLNMHDYGSLIIVSSIAAVIGTAGDLLQSKLKRMAGVKDSGNIMPGHGGFLDRFDSLLLATPFVWLYMKIFML